MTQEQKAKAYDESLERARNLHKDAIDMEEGLLAKQCEIIFPELKESEDERIRKCLLRFHKSTIDIDGIKGDEIVSWLEKQGEQKPTWSEEDEEILNTIIADVSRTLRSCGIGTDEHTIRIKAIDFLKSLRFQNRWKPSEEQLKALHDMNLTGNISYAGQGQVLIELYNDLKKL